MATTTLRNRGAGAAISALFEVFQVGGKSRPMTDDQKEAWEERAAIIEFCSRAGMTRREAEQIAAEQLGLSEDEVEFLMGAKNGRS